MEPIFLLLLFNIIVQSTIEKVEQHRRKRLVRKWYKGQLTLEELQYLKKQFWFRKAFQEVKVDSEKKND
jgi:hypothetical protein